MNLISPKPTIKCASIKTQSISDSAKNKYLGVAGAHRWGMEELAKFLLNPQFDRTKFACNSMNILKPWLRHGFWQSIGYDITMCTMGLDFNTKLFWTWKSN